MFPNVSLVAPDVGALTDRELLDGQAELAAIARRIAAAAAVFAAEIARRSSRELGHHGLAQRLGARTPELLVQRITGESARDSGALVRVGELMAQETPLNAVGAAVADGSIALGAADAIRAGLDGVADAVPRASIVEATESLLRDAAVLPIERLAARAREWGAALDAEHAAARERELRSRRYLRLTPQRDGMTRLSGLLDPESAAIVAAAVDAATSPRRGGPRFVDPAAVVRAQELVEDSRTNGQLAVDTLVELVRIGTAADTGAVLGVNKPAVRVVVTDRASGIVPIRFDDDGRVVDVGRDQRLFTTRQRIGMAVRDGGCLFPECDRPPSWCEAHHITEWRNGGRTDIDEGVLLCRHHHLLVHDDGWRVIREGAGYLLVPPADVDSARTPIPAPSKSGMLQRACGIGGTSTGDPALPVPVAVNA